jgi:hypothetical protein
MPLASCQNPITAKMAITTRRRWARAQSCTGRSIAWVSWRGQMGHEDDLDKRKHRDGECDGGGDLSADRGSRGRDGSDHEYSLSSARITDLLFLIVYGRTHFPYDMGPTIRGEHTGLLSDDSGSRRGHGATCRHHRSQEAGRKSLR